MSEPSVETIGLSKRFRNLQAVEDASLTIPSGSIYGIVGTNGAGKSTFLNMLLGIIRPTDGQARVLGVDAWNPEGSQRQRIGYVTDQDYFFARYSVGEMLEFGRLTYERWDETRCRQLLEAFELPLQRNIRSLSKGMRVQLAFVMALSIHPELLILDEPTSGLDAVVKRQILQLIVQEAANGATVLMATHHLDELERIADRVAFFHQGRIILEASTEDAKRDMRKIQVVFANGMPEELRSDPGVLRVEESGHVYSLIVDRDPERFLELCRRLQPVFLEELEVDFEEVFIHVMHREGYAREQVILA
jgi:ABC-2 type transport system ATP-binding protein